MTAPPTMSETKYITAISSTSPRFHIRGSGAGVGLRSCGSNCSSATRPPIRLHVLRERLPRVGLLLPHDRLGRPHRDDSPAVLTALGSEVDDPIRVADHVH